MPKYKILLIDQDINVHVGHITYWKESDYAQVTQVVNVGQALEEIVLGPSYDFIISNLGLACDAEDRKLLAGFPDYKEYSFSGSQSLEGLTLYFHFIKEHRPTTKTLFAFRNLVSQKFDSLEVPYISRSCGPDELMTELEKLV